MKWWTGVNVDMVKNDQGEMLVECMKSTGLCFVNGRQGPLVYLYIK